MKTRTTRTSRPATSRSASFALHPLGLASLIAVAGPALALPTGGTVVSGGATIAKPSPTQQVVTQTTQKAIIDWTSFSIAAGEKVRFDQPSSSAVILNRVTGYDPSKIFGSLESNGRVFLLNPYGVVFGASARVDVGGLVASSLSLSNADFNAGQLRLTSSDGNGLAVRGEVRNEGVISAPGGTVVLAAPSVTNTGVIEARGGRVGLVAAQDVLVDVEGDGLIFFQASATEASNRLAQLGRIQADGGSVELRAAARGAFADTVLNMGGVVQARAIGVKQGRVVIDGGESGITRVAGTVDASGAGAGEQGGQISVRGQKVLLDLAAVLNASGEAGGGKVTVGGDWQGQGAGTNSEMTHVARGAKIDVSATGNGNAGTAVVWSDDATRFYGAIDARGGAQGGNGGKVEVSGKRYLDFDGTAQLGAAAGAAGELLLDPADITISAAASSGNMSGASPFEATSGTSSNLSVATLNTLLNGAGLVRVNSGGAGTAGNEETGSITVNANVAGTGTASLRLESAGVVTLNNSVTLSGGGSFSVTGEGGAGRAGSFTSGAGGTITTTPTAANVNAGNVSIETNGDITLGAAVTTAATASANLTLGATGGNVTLTTIDGSITTRAITTSGAAAGDNAGAKANRRGGDAGDITIQVLGAATADRNIDVQGAITAVGGRGGDGNSNNAAGGDGGTGGTILVSTVRGTVGTLGIDSGGGSGANGDNANGGVGGAAGAIGLQAAGTNLAVTVGGALSARGGTGGNAVGGNDDGGAGGAGATVGITSVGGEVLLGTAGTIATGGRAGGNGSGATGNDGADGANGGIALSAGTNFTVTSTLDTTGATGAGTVALTVGAAGNGGTLDLGTPGSITAGALTLAGGAGTDQLVATLANGNSSFVRSSGAPGTLTTTGLPAATITSIETADVTGSAGDNTINVAGFGGTATIRVSAGTDTVTGTGANSRTTLIGPDALSAVAISGANAGSLSATGTTTNFTGVGNLTGGSQNDSYTLNAGVTTFGGAIDGGGGTNTLTTTDGTNAIAISGANAGTLNTTTTFAGIATVTGGSGADTFTLGAGVPTFNGTLAGGGGTNALVLTDGTNAITVTGTNAGTLNTDTTFTNIASLAGGSGTDTLTGPAAGTAFAISGANAVTVAGIAATSIDALVGGAGNDTFTLGAGVTTFAGSISGGGGANNTLALTDGTNAITVTGTNAGTVNTDTTFTNIASLAGGSGTDTLTGPAGGATFSITGANAVTVAGVAATSIDALVGGAGNDTFTLASGVTSFGASIDGGTGANTLGATDGANTFTLDAANGGTLNTTTAFTNITTLAGGSGSDTLVAANDIATITLSDASITRTGLTTINLSGFEAASLSGGAGGNDIVASGFAGSVSVTTTAGTDSITGNGANTTLVGPASGNYDITGARAGSVGTTTFSGVGAISGGSGADTFTLGAGVTSFNGTLAGGGGTNALVLTDGANAITLSGANAGTLNGTTNFSGIATLTGGSGTDTLTGPAAGTAFAISGANSVTVAGVAATSIDALVGGAGSDTFTLGAGVASFAGSISGGGGAANALVLTDGTNDIVVTGANAGTVNTTTAFNNIANVAGGTGTDTLTGPAGGAAFSITGAAAVTVAGVGATSIDALVGGAGNDTFTLATGVTNFTGPINGGTGANTLATSDGANAFAVTNGNSGTLNATTSFSNIGSLAGGSGADSFAFAASNTATLTGPVNGGAGSNSLNLNAKAGALVVDQSGSVTENGGAVLAGFSNISSLAGNGTSTELIGSSAGQTFTLNGTDLAGTAGAMAFTGVTRLTGGAGTDTLVVANDVAAITLSNTAIDRSGFTSINLSGFEAASLSGGAGINAITASGFAGTVSVLASSGADTVAGNGANTTLVGTATGSTFTVNSVDGGTLFDGVSTTSFTGVGNLTGGAGNDSFALVDPGGTLSGGINGGGGTNTLDLSNKTSATIVFNQGSSTITGIGVTGAITNITTTIGNGLNTTLVGSNAGQSFSITNNNEITIGGTQVFQGVGNLNAGTGADAITGNINFHLDGNIVDAGGAATLAGTIVTYGNQTYTGAVTAAGPLGLAALGNISATNSGNDFGTLSLYTANAGGVAIVDANNLTLDTVSLAGSGANSISVGTAVGSTLSRTATLAAVNTPTLTVGGVLVNSGVNTLFTSGAASSVQIQAGAGGTHNVSAAGVSVLPGLSVSGDLVVASATNITQSGALTVGGTSSFNAGAGAITLTSANDFQGAVSLTGGTTQITDANALTLGTLATGALTASSTGALGLGQGSVGGTLVATSGGGAVAQSGALTVTGTSAINAGAGAITLTSANDFQGAVSLTGGTTQITDANALTLGTLSTGALTATSTGALGLGQGSVGGTLIATSGGGAVAQSGALTVTGTSSVNAGAGAITLTSANDFQGAVTLTGGTTQITDTNALTLGTLSTGALTASSTGALGLGQGSVGGTLIATSGGGAVAQSGALTVTGTSSVNAGAGGITLTSANDFQGAVSLTGGTTQITDANALTLGTLSTGALTATSTGALGLGQGSVGGTLIATSGGGAVSQSGALTVTGTSSVNAGAGAITLTSANDFQGAVTLTGGTTQITDANALTLGTLSTGALTATSTGALGLGQGSVGGTLIATSGGGAVSQSGALTVTGTSSVNAGAGAITLTSANDFQGAVTLTGGTTQITDANALTLGAVTVAAGQALNVAAAGTITLNNGISTTADQTYAGNVALGNDVTLSAGAGRLDLQGAVNGGGHNLALVSANAASDAIRTGGAISNAAQFSATGNTTLGGSVSSSGSQSYTGPVLLGTAVTLTGTDLNLGSVDGAQALTLAGSGTTTLAGPIGASIALTSLTDGGGGTTRIGSTVTTTGAQTWGDALVLTGASTLSGTTLTFGGTINGAQALTVVGSASTAIFNGAVGNTTALTSLNVTGPAQINGGSVTTTGSQTYSGAVTLGADAVLAGNGIGFASTLDGAHGLTVQNPGTTTFGGAVGGSTPLASLTMQNNGIVSLTGPSITTTGAQSYSGALQLGGNTQLSGGSLTFGAGVSGAQNLLLLADTLSVTGAIAGTGSGTLTIAPQDTGRSIGIAGGAGDLQVSQGLLGSTTGFAQQVIGRTDSSGNITAGALQLVANTTLQTGSGDIRVNSADGGFALTLNSGGLTHIAGPVGTTTALASLTTDNNAGAADWNGTSGERTLIDTVDGSGRARVITTGAQTYNDPLVVLVPVQLNGGAISATQATSRFDGSVNASATQLDLRSGQAITLGDVTLANGGRIETDGVLELAGALVLNGGTLSLITNATPTSVAFTDPELQGRDLAFGREPVTEASATLFQSAGSTLTSTAGSLLVLRSPNGGSLSLENAGNDLRGGISAVSGPLGDNSVSRFTTLPLGFVRIVSTEINAVGAPPTDGSQTLEQAGIEGDVLKLTADKITTGPSGQLRARLPFDNSQGSQSSVPGMTLIMSPTALTIGGGFGLATPGGYIQVRIGNELGGFLTVRPRGVSGDNAFILLAGPDPKPFYDGNGKLTEVRVFYNGDAPRTPQESGALTAVTAIVEDARQTRFEEAVRTENVKSRLRSGVIAEVGAGRPATVGRESIMMPPNCNPKPASLQCE